MSKAYTDLLLDTCLLAGKIMMESGAEMYRVEDTMNRIATVESGKKGISFVTPTGIFMAIEGGSSVKLQQIPSRSINLERVSKVNDLSREFSAQKIDLTTLSTRLKKVESENDFFPIWLQIIAAAVVSGTLMILFGGAWPDFIQSCVIGAIGFAVYFYSNEFLKIKFLAEFFASFIIGLLAIITVSIGWGVSVDGMIIGSVMPLVPGVPITNSVRDLLAGHLLSGMARGTEALITACMIGIGIAVVFQMFY
ncbi:threonine/serine exporter family protein [Carnobacterium divergens]|uniref:Threonine/serine exporter n=1 Tax=Carnobacterium divergens TaxID=2748 RepID=A0A2R8A3T7_CARDV|nr:threonine/serine exporter family protein [Carnobacterium divergens]MPQ23134.1 threonine/serine exporter [Carnobacterium divergens]TFI63539.1 threonine/serine exporter [Carnobacterium divergens]TFI73909.1 threonine/serine exporter [Carnobacterium divergens]TFI77879.1 threonine/serine exporter [Carnobacterium divergens]TFI84720.1 threonine/serine exporter [Carnobacterium divergens]